MCHDVSKGTQQLCHAIIKSSMAATVAAVVVKWKVQPGHRAIKLGLRTIKLGHIALQPGHIGSHVLSDHIAHGYVLSGDIALKNNHYYYYYISL